MKKLLLTALSLLMITTFAHAQEDILQENDFLDSPDVDNGGGLEEPPPQQDNPNQSPSAPPTNFAPAVGGSGGANPAFGGSKKRKVPPLSQATDADITNQNYPDLIDSFDFPNADIADVIKAISELTGKNFIVDPNVSGKITIMAPTQITVAEAYKVFLSALAIRGFSVVPAGKFLKILPVRDAQRDNLEIFSGAYTPDTDQMITRIIHLKYVPAAEMNKFATKLVSKNGNIDIYEPTNSLIVSDQASSVQRLMKIVGQLDIAGFDEQLAVINIKNAKAKDIAELIDQIINKGQKKNAGGGFSSGIPRFRPGGNQQSTGGSAFSTVIPDDRTNSVIVVGNKAGIDKIRKLVATLDFKLTDAAGGAYVYYVKHGEADKISDIINGIAKQLKDEQKGQNGTPSNIPPAPVFTDNFGAPMGQNTTPTSTGLFGADVKVSADKDTNSLIIVGNKQDYMAVLALLAKIDIPRDQVYVESIIMEMNANNATNFGMSYYKIAKGTDGLGRIGFGGTSKESLAGLSSIGGEGAILGFGSGETVDINVGGTKVQVKSLMAFLTLLTQNTKSDVLATPQIIAMDNEEATVEVGQEVPVAINQSTAAGGATTNNVEREKATIKLVIKPHISPSSETVRMSIKQTIAQVDSNPTEGSELAKISRTLAQRAIETNIVMRDGDTAVLGGLMRDEARESVTKVPLLGDIPVLGWLFKSSQKSVVKQNLIVFITPRVIRNPEDSNRLLSRKLDERVRYVKDAQGGKDIHGAIAENMRPTLKAPPKKSKNTKENKIEDEFIQEE